MEVWIVSMNERDDQRIVGIFSDRLLAEASLGIFDQELGKGATRFNEVDSGDGWASFRGVYDYVIESRTVDAHCQYY